MPKIKAGGVEYAADITGGALLDFKEEAGFDFLLHADLMDTPGLITLAWASAKNAAEERGEPFGLSRKAFARKLSLPEINALASWMTEALGSPGGKEGTAPDDKKKQA